MIIYLIRHAEAAPLGGPIFRDFDRPLTEHGRSTSTALCRYLAEHGIQWDGIISSRLVRAIQTAEYLLPCSVSQEFSYCDHLAPDSDKPKKIAEFIAGYGASRVAVVGHQPDLGGLLGWLIGMKDRWMELEKASVACVETSDDLEKGTAELQWLITPLHYMK